MEASVARAAGATSAARAASAAGAARADWAAKGADRTAGAPRAAKGATIAARATKGAIAACTVQKVRYHGQSMVLLRGHLGVSDTVSGPLIVPLNYPVILH